MEFDYDKFMSILDSGYQFDSTERLKAAVDECMEGFEECATFSEDNSSSSIEEMAGTNESDLRVEQLMQKVKTLENQLAELSNRYHVHQHSMQKIEELRCITTVPCRIKNG